MSCLGDGNRRRSRVQPTAWRRLSGQCLVAPGALPRVADTYLPESVHRYPALAFLDDPSCCEPPASDPPERGAAPRVRTSAFRPIRCHYAPAVRFVAMPRIAGQLE